MKMKNPPHPGTLIRNNLDDLGLTVAEGAAGIGVTRQQIYNVMGGRCGVTPEMAVRLEKAFGGSAEAWLRLQANYDLAQVRRQATEINATRLLPRRA
jgi:addiction module HigA family antidote